MPKRKFDQQADQVEKIVDIIRSLEKDIIQDLESGQDGWKSKIDALLKYLQPNQLSGAIFASVKSLDRIFSKCINHIHCTELDPPFVFQSENLFEEVRNTELELQLLRQSATALEASSNRSSLLSKLNINVGPKEATPTQPTDSFKWNITLQDNHLLRKKFTEYLMTASNLLHHDDQGLHVPVWKTLMGYVNHELEESKQRKSMLIAWESLLFDFMIYSMVHTNSVASQELMNELKQLLEYDDIKYMVLSALGQYATDGEKARNVATTQMLYQLASEVHIPPQVTKFYSSKDRSPEQLAVLLKAQEKKIKLQDIGQNENNNNNKKEKKQKEDEINIFDDEPEEEPKKKKKNQNNMTIKFRDRKLEGQLDMLRLNVYRKAFQNCWLGILSLPLSDSTYKKILASTHTHIFPSMVKPSLLIDFLTEAYDRGGIYSILALHGVFMLMTQHGLEYPDFYNKLYAILDETIFTAKYRVRFWRLLDLFFTSSHLPQYVVASFIKKMSRLALTAPAHGSIVAQVFAYTLLQRHPSCAPLVHKLAQKPMTKSVLLIGENATKNYSEGIPVEELEGFDHYKANEKDTAKSDALQSSLWELQVMSLHYLPAVSRLTKIFQSIGKIYSVQDFDDESYQSLFEDEINRIVKEDFPLAFKDTDALFSTKDIAEGFDGWELS